MKWTEPPGYLPNKDEFDEAESCYDAMFVGVRRVLYFACAVILIVAGFALAATV